MGKVLHLQKHLPTPTKKDPYRQLDWIFQDKISLYSNRHSRENYSSGLSIYKRFLKHTNNYSEALQRDPRFHLKEQWDVFALLKVKNWLDTTNFAGNDDYLASASVTSMMSALRQTMEHAYEHAYIEKPIIKVSLRTVVRETVSRTAYSVDEYERIFKVLAPLIKFSKGLLQPYVPTGKGKDPRVMNRRKVPQGSIWGCQSWTFQNDDGELLAREDNLRWYFENVMKCVPLPSVPENIKHKQFFNTASFHAGIKTLYRNWGVSCFIDTDVMMPLLIELISETGLNVESVLSLKRDCFMEAHPLTGLPFLQYDKPRSGGEKELHIALYDNNHRDSMGLKQRQSRIISNSIATILKLTEPLVEQASKEDQRYLFLCQPRGRTSAGALGRVKRISLRIVQNWTGKMIKEYHLRADNGDVLSFNLSRFRPTKITEMVAQGHDFFDIMAVTGHASIITTLSYIDGLKWARDFNQKIEQALTTIKKNKQEYERNPLPVAITRTAKAGDFIFKAPVCHCRNPYDPPEVVRKSSNYIEGDACSYFNMCLSCDNVLVTEMNLPKLFAYRTAIESALANVSEIPRQGELYKKTKMLLDQILAPEVLFSRDNLDWAAHLAQVDDFEVLDSFIFQSVEA